MSELQVLNNQEANLAEYFSMLKLTRQLEIQLFGGCPQHGEFVGNGLNLGQGGIRLEDLQAEGPKEFELTVSGE